MNKINNTFYSFQYWSNHIRYNILRFKNNGNLTAMKYLADLCIPDIRELFTRTDCDALAYVPSENRPHMKLFAEYVGERLNAKVWHGIFKRYGVPSLCTCPSTAARRAVIRNAFYMVGHNAPVKTLLLDNVITTGSTLAELTDLLEKHFVSTVCYCVSAVHKKI